MGQIGCTETSVNRLKETLRNIIEEQRSDLYCGVVLELCYKTH